MSAANEETNPVERMVVCPECGKELMYILNDRMDEKIEKIPICNNCTKAFRWPELGWEILDT